MGHIIDRSRDEAAKAMIFLPQKDREIIQNLVIGMNRLESEVMTNIIKKMYS